MIQEIRMAIDPDIFTQNNALRRIGVRNWIERPIAHQQARQNTKAIKAEQLKMAQW